MAEMSRHNSAKQLQGFSVYQPTLGAQLLFFPALGSKELDQLIDAYLPGPASTKEKRAAIALDFFDHARLTGESFKFYTVGPVTASPASTTSIAWDSAYGSASGFDMSPALSDVTSWSFASLPQHHQDSLAGPAACQQQQKSRPAKKVSPSTRPSTDFSSLPGMKILTKDGRDVTNSASRGCKTKEQRDHAHLMRIIKACDSCRRKKIRCDPSHKKRTASSQSLSEAKPAKKAKKVVTEARTGPKAPVLNTPSLSFKLDSALPQLQSPADAAPQQDNSWEQFAQLDQDFNFPPAELDMFLNSAEYFSPTDLASSSSSSSFFTSNSSSCSPSQPLTPAHPGPSPVSAAIDIQSQQQQPAALPYLDAFQAGADYVDFSLYSPQSNFLDEDPIPLKSTQVSPAVTQEERVEPSTQYHLQTIEQSWSSLESPEPLSLSDVQHATLLDTDDFYLEPTENIGGVKDETCHTSVSQLLQTHPTTTHLQAPNSLSSVLPPPQTSRSPTLSPSAGEDGVRLDGIVQPYGNSNRHLQPTRQQLAGPESTPRGPGHSESCGEYGIDSHPAVLASQASSQISHAATPSIGPLSRESSPLYQVDVRWPAAPEIYASGVLSVASSGSSTYATIVSGITSGDESRAENVNNAARLRRRAPGVASATDSSASEFHHSSLGSSSVGSDISVNEAFAFDVASGYGLNSVVSRLCSGAGFSNCGVALSSSVDDALNLIVAAMVLVLNSVLLTLQTGSAKMPEGLFGLVYGGVMVLAQALWPHTPPRSSKPAPEDHYSSAPGGGIAVADGGWFNGKMVRAWRSLQCSIREKIGQLSGSIVFEGRQLSLWRL